MFTGIIETLSTIEKINQTKTGNKIILTRNKVLDDLMDGDSISVNGVCLTITNLTNKTFTLEIVKETLTKTNLGELKTGEVVNLERALTLSKRLGGHILQGHVETTGVIVDKSIIGDSAEMTVAIDPKFLRYCIPKGSIALDGISLTIADLNENFVKIALIPHTLQNTTLGLKIEGDSLNIETDIIGKYIERLISLDELDEDLDPNLLIKLRSWGFGET